MESGLRRTKGTRRAPVAPLRQAGRGAECARLTPVWFVADSARGHRNLPDFKTPGLGGAPRRLESPRDTLFEAKAVLRMEPDVGLMSCFDPAPLWAFDASALAQASALVVRPSNGIVVVHQDGAQVVVASREAAIISCAKAARFVLTDVDRLDCFLLPRSASEDPFAEATLRKFAQDNGALLLLGHYAAALMRGLLPMNSDGLQDLSMRYMRDLVAKMFEDGPVVEQAPRPAMRLRAIMVEIEARLDQQSLSAQEVASQHGVSTRYLQKLFEAEGGTFSEYVLRRRLERAVLLLQSSEAPQRPISSIAFDVGFDDLSYFNRTFRRRFGSSPREIRARHRANLLAQGSGGS
ncbi:transcriptional regulator, AraC family [Beijerinckia sp. 28-YEA-48]|nr:transcriptional regulator, AraC family [Beijerinckia sp. 28-YEA-48]